MTAALILLIILLLYLFLIFPGRRQLPEKFRRDYAHRGLHDNSGDNPLPENSLAAFGIAAEKGFGIELDVQLSKDGEVYVFHDYSLERMTGCKSKLSELDSTELDKLRLLGTDEHIPRFKEVLDLVAGRVPILVELKGESLDSSLCPKTDSLLGEYKGAYIVESFNPMLLFWYRKNRPEVIRGQLYTNVVKSKGFTALNLCLTGMLFNFLARPDFVAYDKERPGALPVAITRLFGAGQFVWTIKSREEYDKKGKAFAIFEGFMP